MFRATRARLNIENIVNTLNNSYTRHQPRRFWLVHQAWNIKYQWDSKGLTTISLNYSEPFVTFDAWFGMHNPQNQPFKQWAVLGFCSSHWMLQHCTIHFRSSLYQWQLKLGLWTHQALPSWLDGADLENGLQVPHLALSIASLPWAFPGRISLDWHVWINFVCLETAVLMASPSAPKQILCETWIVPQKRAVLVGQQC